MTSRAFEAVLGKSDTDASQLQFFELVSAQKFTGPNLPTVAEKYLNVFCDVTASVVRRRWIGLAIAGMLRESIAVVARLKEARRQMQAIGSIILSDTEHEETKITAGIIMRQALAQGFEYSSFWASEKVRNSAPPFPENLETRWLAAFQSFLDALHSLALIGAETKASIIYPISIVTSDGFRWRESDEGVPIALLQAGVLTVIAPNSDLSSIQFIDISVEHICGMETKPSSLHDSQARDIHNEPWDLTLILKSQPSTYHLNRMPRTGNEVTFLFQHFGDAKEWETCIKEHPKDMADIDSRSSLVMDSVDSRSTAINGLAKSRSRNARSEGPAQQLASPLKDGESHGGVQVSSPGSHNFRPRHPSSRSHDKMGSSVISQATENYTGSTIRKEQENSSGARKLRPVNKQGQIKTSSARQTAHSNSEGSSHEKVRLEQDSDANEAPSKGRLPRVSQSVKAKIQKDIPVHPDVFELPSDESCSTTMENGRAEEKSMPHMASHKRLRSSRSSAPRLVPSRKATSAKAKRKADEYDDDFVPRAKPRRKKIDNGREVVSTTGVGDRDLRKRATFDTPDDGTTKLSQAVTTKEKARTLGLEQVESSRTSKATREKQQSQRASPVKPTSSLASSRPSLIGDLRNSQKPVDTPTTSFKKPNLPLRSVRSPATPAQPISRGCPAQLKTPLNGRRLSNAVSPLMPSSPPANVQEGDMEDMQGIEVGNDWLEDTLVDTEILSSNSKPVPASPHAESTAISGHAVREDVDLEKRRGDVQMARSDPFQQRRQSSKATSFIRRLTGEGSDLSPLVTQPYVAPKPWDRTSLSAGGKKDIVKYNTVEAITPHKPTIQTRTCGEAAGGSARCNRPRTVAVGEEIEAAATVAAFASRSVNISAVNNHVFIPKQAHTKLAGHLSCPTNTSTSFTKPDHRSEDSILSRSQPVIDDTQLAQLAHSRGNVDQGIYEDATMVNDGSDDQLELNSKSLPMQFASSPPYMGSPSSHSSTSAGSGSFMHRPPPSSDAEEMEWEASLQPHQRTLHDVLMRTSKRVLRHIVDNETAVTDIAEIFGRDGEHVLHSLLQRHDHDYDVVFQDMQIKKNGLQQELHRAVNHLAKERRRIRASA